MMTYKGYVGNVEYDDEAKIFAGTVINTRTVITFQGTSVDELEKEFHTSVDDYLDWCKSDGVCPEKPYSGRFNVRFLPELHQRAAIVAKKLNLTKTDNASKIGESGGSDGASAAGKQIAENLKSIGFNMALSPVADISVTDGNVLGARSFGADEKVVGSMASAFSQALQDNGIHACMMQFPGKGSVTEKSTEGMAKNERSLEELQSAEFAAYKTVIDSGVRFALVSNISAPQLTGDNTACCLSSEAISQLRNALGFEGVILAGPLNEAAITDYHTSDEAASMAIAAGADMIYLVDDFEKAYNALLEHVQKGEISEQRIDESLLRIYRVKYMDKIDSITES